MRRDAPRAAERLLSDPQVCPEIPAAPHEIRPCRLGPLGISRPSVTTLPRPEHPPSDQETMMSNSNHTPTGGSRVPAGAAVDEERVVPTYPEPMDAIPVDAVPASPSPSRVKDLPIDGPVPKLVVAVSFG